MVIEDTLFVLFRRVPHEKALESWYKTTFRMTEPQKPICLVPDKNYFFTSLQTQFPHYSTNEAEYAYEYSKSFVEKSNGIETGIYGLLAESVSNILTTDIRNECLCKYNRLLEFRELSHPIDPLIFQSAFLARKDLNTSYKRDVFSWPLNIHTDNYRLQKILDKGISENHFHVGGSSNSFHFSWICLMNNFTAHRKEEFKKENFDFRPLDSKYSLPNETDSYYLSTFKAACIRAFLYLRLRNQWILSKDSIPDNSSIEDENNKWLLKMLYASESECDVYSCELNNILFSLKSLCKDDGSGFVADYAIEDEPFAPSDNYDVSFFHGLAVRNYERKLFYHLSGEQRFLYNLFLAIYSGDKKIKPYLDLVYAYLLIYCKVRSELIQVNNRVGFGNFLEYQNRKELFTKQYPKYEQIRTSIAQQVVLLNPQVVSFEGRLGPADTAQKLTQKISTLYWLATKTINNDSSFEETLKAMAEKKLYYALHFSKKSQSYSQDDNELIIPRDNDKRKEIRKQASAIIQARLIAPDTMSLVRGIDAASNEIDCRPEVFAPDFRRIRQYRYPFDKFVSKFPYPNLKITYHVGEDFLDPIDGLRAIDEAISFLEMSNGDRLGHALALGIDCESWYNSKNHTVLLKKQALLDNLTWLYGKMHHYNIQNTAAEDQIIKWYKKLFTEIYLNTLFNATKSIIYAADILDYYPSLKLRGNEPDVYYYNPEGSEKERMAFEKALEDSKLEPWKIRTKAGKSYDPISNALYHYYHFNNKAKYISDSITEYYVPKCIIDAVCMVQEKMQYDISRKNISIECNPSSNFLIGTFKDYLKHPIFRFNNKNLYSANDKRSLNKNPLLSASINTDDLGIFDTSLENEYALVACALENHNRYCNPEDIILPDNIYSWLDNIREQGCLQSFKKIT